MRVRIAMLWLLCAAASLGAQSQALPQRPQQLSPQRAAQPLELRVMSFNIWYGGEQVNFASVVEAIRAADADLVGVQEPEGNLRRLAAAAGYAHVDERRNLLSRFPLFDPGDGRRSADSAAPAGIVALDEAAVHAWVMVRPGQVVALANVHLTSDDYGPEAIRDGADLASMLAAEQRTRLRETRPLLALRQLPAATPVFLTGDFNTPSHLDWGADMQRLRPEVIRYPVNWPVTRLLSEAGFRDSFREAHPDPTRRPGYTWTPGMPHPYIRPRETVDRIDFVWSAGAVETLRSELVGERGGDGVDIAVHPYPSDHRAVVSTFRATPVAAPPLVGVEPRTVRRGEDFLVRGHDPQSEGWRVVIVHAGSPPTAALLRVEETVAAWRAAGRVASRALAAGEYDAVLLAADGSELRRSRFAIREAAAPVLLQVQGGGGRAGEPLRVRWSNGPGHRHDWIGLFRPGAAADAALVRSYVDARHGGELLLPTIAGDEPLPPGEYELRFLRDDSPTTEASLRMRLR